MANEDELRPEYDFSKLGTPVRGKYAEAYREGTNLVLLDEDVAKVFTTAESVNKALGALLEAVPPRSEEVA